MSSLDNEVFQGLRKKYVLSFPEKINALKQALDSKDYETIENFGHRLRGSGQSYGFPELSKLGHEIEQAGLCTQSVQLNLLIEELKSTLENISKQFNAAEDC